MNPEVRLLLWTVPALLSAACLFGCIVAWAKAAATEPDRRAGVAGVAWTALAACVILGVAAFILAGTLYSDAPSPY